MQDGDADIFLFITAMTSFKDARNLILESYSDCSIDDDEFILLYEGNFLKNPEFQYEYNERFGLDAMDDTIQFNCNLNSRSNINFTVLEKEK